MVHTVNVVKVMNGFLVAVQSSNKEQQNFIAPTLGAVKKILDEAFTPKGE